MQYTPTLLEMLKAGVHFGHRSSKWHPHMEPYIFTTKKNVHIIDLESTQQKLAESVNVVRDLTAQGKIILFVGTKPQAQAIIKKYASACGMPYTVNRWIGGMLTNFRHMSTVTRKLTSLKQQRETGELKKYTKKEQLEFDREIERLEEMVGGIEHMTKLPDMVFIVDLSKEKTALREALQIQIPILAMCDTNVDPKSVDYPIPSNDDAVKSIELIVRSIAEAVEEGKKNPIVTPTKTETPAAAPASPETAKQE